MNILGFFYSLDYHLIEVCFKIPNLKRVPSFQFRSRKTQQAKNLQDTRHEATEKKEETRVCKFEELALKREVRVCGREKENGPDAGNGRSLS